MTSRQYIFTDPCCSGQAAAMCGTFPHLGVPVSEPDRPDHVLDGVSTRRYQMTSAQTYGPVGHSEVQCQSPPGQLHCVAYLSTTITHREISHHIPPPKFAMPVQQQVDKIVLTHPKVWYSLAVFKPGCNCRYAGLLC